MSNTVIGIFAGLLIGLGIAIDGFSGFLLLVVFGAVGLVVGKVVDGDIDVSQYLGGRGGQGRVSK